MAERIVGFTVMEDIGVGVFNLAEGSLDAVKTASVKAGESRYILRAGAVLDIVPMSYELREFEMEVNSGRAEKERKG